MRRGQRPQKPHNMSYLLKRTKKTCIKFIRKLSNKQIFLKRLEEEDICEDIDISLEAKERDINQNESISSDANATTCNNKQKKVENQTSATRTESHEPAPKDVRSKRKLSIHFEEVKTDKAVLQSLTSKLFLTADGYEFRRLQQLRSDTASEVVPFDGHFATGKAVSKADGSPCDDDTKIEVVFEKVKYKEDVRYLRHTPSTCSLDNYIINDENEVDAVGDEELMMNTMININNNNKNMYDYDYTNNTTTTRGLEMHNNHFACNSSPKSDQEKFLQQPSSQSQQLNNMLPLNVSLGCIADGNYHKFFISEERDYFYKLTPVVKWDINGNSLEDDDFPEFGLNAQCSPAKSSLRSSSTTLETWLEEE